MAVLGTLAVTLIIFADVVPTVVGDRLDALVNYTIPVVPNKPDFSKPYVPKLNFFAMGKNGYGHGYGDGDGHGHGHGHGLNLCRLKKIWEKERQLQEWKISRDKFVKERSRLLSAASFFTGLFVYTIIEGIPFALGCCSFLFKNVSFAVRWLTTHLAMMDDEIEENGDEWEKKTPRWAKVLVLALSLALFLSACPWVLTGLIGEDRMVLLTNDCVPFVPKAPMIEKNVEAIRELERKIFWLNEDLGNVRYRRREYYAKMAKYHKDLSLQTESLTEKLGWRLERKLYEKELNLFISMQCLIFPGIVISISFILRWIVFFYNCFKALSMMMKKIFLYFTLKEELEKKKIKEKGDDRNRPSFFNFLDGKGWSLPEFILKAKVIEVAQRLRGWITFAERNKTLGGPGLDQIKRKKKKMKIFFYSHKKK